MKRNKFLILIIISIMLINVQIYSQIDNDFWFVAPDVDPCHGNTPIVFRVFTYDMPANVTLSQPANPSFTPMTAYIPAHDSHTFDLTSFISTTMCAPENTILNYGYNITSDSDVSAYYEVMTVVTPEIFSLKGKNALGTEFMIPFNSLYYNGVCGPDPIGGGGFNIVATKDSTAVTITPSHDLIGHPAGVPFTIYLNKGQTYFCKIVEPDPANNPMGTIVSSNKPITITIFDDGAKNVSGTCGDLIGDQITPLNIIGNEYIVIRGFIDNGDRVFITAPYDNTDIFINGTFQANINSGQTYTYVLNDPQTSVYINTSNNVYVYHTTGFGCELGSAVLPSIKCTGSLEVSFVRRTSEYLGLIIMTESGSEDNFLFNGNPSIVIASDFLTVPDTAGQYVAARKEISTAILPADSTGILQNTAGTFHLGIINGGSGSGCEYGFFSDYANNYSFHITHNGSEIDTVFLCEGDSMLLESNHILGANYEWTGPNYFYSNEDTIVLNNLNVSNNGFYKLNGNTSNCPILGDSIYLQVNLKPIIDINASSAEICLGESSDLTVSSDITGTTFNWSNGLGTNPNVTVSPTTTTTYSVTGTTPDGCTGTAEVTVTVHNLQNIDSFAYYLPNAITPNDDGKNDFFNFSATNIEFTNFEMRIFDRWGKQIFFTTNPNLGWDGKYKGKLVPQGVYSYIINFTDSQNFNRHTLHGRITVIY
jgi:gliding motility-associated-like protein